MVLKKLTSLVTKAKGHTKVAKKGYPILVIAMLIVHRIGMKKVFSRVHQTQEAQVIQCCHQLLRAKVVDLVSPAIVVAV